MAEIQIFIRKLHKYVHLKNTRTEFYLGKKKILCFNFSLSTIDSDISNFILWKREILNSNFDFFFLLLYLLFNLFYLIKVVLLPNIATNFHVKEVFPKGHVGMI